jgi:hypothetical protein
MSDQLPVPAASNTFERIKRVNPDGAEFWSARELARVLGPLATENPIISVHPPCLRPSSSFPHERGSPEDMQNFASGEAKFRHPFGCANLDQ